MEKAGPGGWVGGNFLASGLSGLQSGAKYLPGPNSGTGALSGPKSGARVLFGPNSGTVASLYLIQEQEPSLG